MVARFLFPNSRLIDFSSKHEVALEREPHNSHDSRAVRVVVRQHVEDSSYVETIPLGYVPKDVSFHLATILDSAEHLCELESSYRPSCKVLRIVIDLLPHIL